MTHQVAKRIRRELRGRIGEDKDVGSGLADGLPRLRAGRSVRLGGLGPIFDGVYHLVATRHLFTVGEGYRTEFDAERPGVGAA